MASPIKPASIGELADQYGVTKKVLRSWLAIMPDLGERKGHLYTTRQIKQIYLHLGDPDAH